MRSDVREASNVAAEPAQRLDQRLGPLAPFTMGLAAGEELVDQSEGGGRQHLARRLEGQPPSFC